MIFVVARHQFFMIFVVARLQFFMIFVVARLQFFMNFVVYSNKSTVSYDAQTVMSVQCEEGRGRGDFYKSMAKGSMDGWLYGQLLRTQKCVNKHFSIYDTNLLDSLLIAPKKLC